MSNRQVIEYIIEEPPPEEPPPRPWWLAMLRVAAAMLGIVLVAFIGYRVAEGLAERVGTVSTGPTIVEGREVTIQIPAGATAKGIAEILVREGVIADGGEFETEVRRQGAAARLKAGTYDVVTGAPHLDLIAMLVEGPPPVETFRLTVIEGLRLESMLASLAEQTGFTVGDFEAALSGGEVTSVYLPDDLPTARPELARWEGLLAPDTYEFTVQATPDAILQRMADTLAARVSSLDWTAVTDLGLTPYDGIIIASLIETEAKLENERPIISSVIHNRLAIGQRLQIDATIIYALGKNPGQLLSSDLEIDSPYNTYLTDGLPPTPISGVRTSSIQAAANPAETEFFYYVLIDEDGTHGFSVTLAEHNEKKAQARADGVIP